MKTKIKKQYEKHFFYFLTTKHTNKFDICASPLSALYPGRVLWAGGAGKVHQLVAVLADEPLLVITRDVVPHLGGTRRVNPSALQIFKNMNSPLRRHKSY